MNNQELFKDQYGDGGEQGGQRNPERGGADVVAVHRGLAGPDVVGLHVHHVVLPQVVHRRGIEVLGRTEVHPVHPLHAVLLTQDQHLLPLAVDGEVARHADGIEQGHLVTVDAVAARAGHLAQHGDAEVHVFHGHHGILDQVFGQKLLLDKGGNLLTVLAGYLNLAQHGEINHSLFIDRIAGYTLAVIGRCVGGHRSLSDLLPYIRQVKQLGQLRVAAVDDDGEFVAGTDLDFGGRHHLLLALTGAQVLKIGNPGGSGAGHEAPHGPKKPCRLQQQGSESCFHNDGMNNCYKVYFNKFLCLRADRLLPAVNQDIQVEVEGHPQPDIDAQNQGHAAVREEQEVQHDEEEGHRQDGDHDPAYPHARAQQLVVKMVLVRQEGTLAGTQAVNHHPDHIEQGHNQGGQSNDQRRIGVRVRVEAHKAEVDYQKAQDVAQRQAAGIAHEQLVPFLGVAEHVVNPERNQDAQGGQGQEGVDVLADPDVHPGQHGQRDAAQSGSQPVDPVDQVDGVGDVHNEKEGERNAQPGRQVVDAEESTQGMNPVAAEDQQQGRQDLDQELPAVPHPDQVVLHPDEVEEHGPHHPEQKLVEGARERQVLDGEAHQVTETGHHGKRDDNGR